MATKTWNPREWLDLHGDQGLEDIRPTSRRVGCPDCGNLATVSLEWEREYGRWLYYAEIAEPCGCEVDEDLIIELATRGL